MAYEEVERLKTFPRDEGFHHINKPIVCGFGGLSACAVIVERVQDKETKQWNPNLFYAFICQAVEPNAATRAPPRAPVSESAVLAVEASLTFEQAMAQ